MSETRECPFCAASLGHTLHVHGGKFGGVLNGVDYDMWNPEVDPWIARTYSPDSVEHKYHNKHALRDRWVDEVDGRLARFGMDVADVGVEGHD